MRKTTILLLLLLIPMLWACNDRNTHHKPNYDTDHHDTFDEGITHLPEPASIWLALIGLTSLFFIVKNKKEN
jgi:hypothetical protein